uniref:Uncharacterized protein n=1 Tax=Solanum tuberosum TaxID=4113 RepID=M1DJL8_SOLTU
MVENCQESLRVRSLTLKIEKCRIKTFWDLFATLSRVGPATTVLTLLQRPRPGGRNPAPAACTEPVSKIKNSKPPFHSMPSARDTQKIPFTLRSIPGVLLTRIQFRKVVQIP